jgi:hypothetical protein
MEIDDRTQGAITAITNPQEFSPERQRLARAVIVDALVRNARGVHPIELAQNAMLVDDRRAAAEILGKVSIKKDSER